MCDFSPGTTEYARYGKRFGVVTGEVPDAGLRRLVREHWNAHARKRVPQRMCIRQHQRHVAESIACRFNQPQRGDLHTAHSAPGHQVRDDGQGAGPGATFHAATLRRPGNHDRSFGSI